MNVRKEVRLGEVCSAQVQVQSTERTGRGWQGKGDYDGMGGETEGPDAKGEGTREAALRREGREGRERAKGRSEPDTEGGAAPSWLALSRFLVSHSDSQLRCLCQGRKRYHGRHGGRKSGAPFSGNTQRNARPRNTGKERGRGAREVCNRLP